MSMGDLLPVLGFCLEFFLIKDSNEIPETWKTGPDRRPIRCASTFVPFSYASLPLSKVEG